MTIQIIKIIDQTMAVLEVGQLRNFLLKELIQLTSRQFCNLQKVDVGVFVYSLQEQHIYTLLSSNPLHIMKIHKMIASTNDSKHEVKGASQHRAIIRTA